MLHLRYVAVFWIRLWKSFMSASGHKNIWLVISYWNWKPVTQKQRHIPFKQRRTRSWHTCQNNVQSSFGNTFMGFMRLVRHVWVGIMKLNWWKELDMIGLVANFSKTKINALLAFFQTTKLTKILFKFYKNFEAKVKTFTQNVLFSS